MASRDPLLSSRLATYRCDEADVNVTESDPLPNPTTIVFHDHPLPLKDEAAAPTDTTHIVGWIFANDDNGALLNVCQTLLTDRNSRDILIQNGTINSPALSPWTHSILALLRNNNWHTAKRVTLRGNAATHDRAWRRDLERHRDYELRTGSLDAVRLHTQRN